MKITAFVVFNKSGLYYGDGGFAHVSPQDATQFDAAEALQMLRVFPNTSTVRVTIKPRGYRQENTRELASFHELHAAA